MIHDYLKHTYFDRAGWSPRLLTWTPHAPPNQPPNCLDYVWNGLCCSDRRAPSQPNGTHPAWLLSREVHDRVDGGETTKARVIWKRFDICMVGKRGEAVHAYAGALHSDNRRMHVVFQKVNAGMYVTTIAEDTAWCQARVGGRLLHHAAMYLGSSVLLYHLYFMMHDDSGKFVSSPEALGGFPDNRTAIRASANTIFGPVQETSDEVTRALVVAALAKAFPVIDRNFVAASCAVFTEHMMQPFVKESLQLNGDLFDPDLWKTDREVLCSNILNFVSIGQGDAAPTDLKTVARLLAKLDTLKGTEMYAKMYGAAATKLTDNFGAMDRVKGLAGELRDVVSGSVVQATAWAGVYGPVATKMMRAISKVARDGLAFDPGAYVTSTGNVATRMELSQKGDWAVQVRAVADDAVKIVTGNSADRASFVLHTTFESRSAELAGLHAQRARLKHAIDHPEPVAIGPVTPTKQAAAALVSEGLGVIHAEELERVEAQIASLSSGTCVHVNRLKLTPAAAVAAVATITKELERADEANASFSVQNFVTDLTEIELDMPFALVMLQKQTLKDVEEVINRVLFGFEVSEYNAFAPAIAAVGTFRKDHRELLLSFGDDDRDAICRAYAQYQAATNAFATNYCSCRQVMAPDGSLVPMPLTAEQATVAVAGAVDLTSKFVGIARCLYGSATGDNTVATAAERLNAVTVDAMSRVAGAAGELGEIAILDHFPSLCLALNDTLPTLCVNSSGADRGLMSAVGRALEQVELAEELRRGFILAGGRTPTGVSNQTADFYRVAIWIMVHAQSGKGVDGLSPWQRLSMCGPNGELYRRLRDVYVVQQLLNRSSPTYARLCYGALVNMLPVLQTMNDVGFQRDLADTSGVAAAAGPGVAGVFGVVYKVLRARPAFEVEAQGDCGPVRDEVYKHYVQQTSAVARGPLWSTPMAFSGLLLFLNSYYYCAAHPELPLGDAANNIYEHYGDAWKLQHRIPLDDRFPAVLSSVVYASMLHWWTVIERACAAYKRATFR